MAWETRSRGTRYYTRSVKRNGRVIRQYVGSGVFGEVADLIDQAERAARQEREKERRQELAEVKALTDCPELTELCQATDTLVTALMLASGYHRHNRGEWRKRRNGEKAA